MWFLRRKKNSVTTMHCDFQNHQTSRWKFFFTSWFTCMFNNFGWVNVHPLISCKVLIKLHWVTCIYFLVLNSSNYPYVIFVNFKFSLRKERKIVCLMPWKRKQSLALSGGNNTQYMIEKSLKAVFFFKTPLRKGPLGETLKISYNFASLLD